MEEYKVTARDGLNLIRCPLCDRLRPCKRTMELKVHKKIILTMQQSDSIYSPYLCDGCHEYFRDIVVEMLRERVNRTNASEEYIIKVETAH